MLGRILLNVGLFIAAIACMAVKQSPWGTTGVFLLLMAGVLTLFTVRDAVVHGLARAGYPVARDRVMIHLYAALMALLAYVIGFSDPGGHGYDIRWYMLFILPLMVYLFNFVHDRTMRLIGRLFERR